MIRKSIIHTFSSSLSTRTYSYIALNVRVVIMEETKGRISEGEYSFLEADKAKPTPTWHLPKRYMVSFLTFCGVCTQFIMRTNLSIAVVEMNSSKQFTRGNSTYTEKGEFDWSSMDVGLMLSSYSWGSLISPISGVVVLKFGGATVFGASMAACAILSILTPFLVRLPLIIFIATRVMGGMFESFQLSAITDIFVHWAPPHERVRLLANVFGGIYLGAGINYPFSGYIAKTLGWQAIFYVTGMISLAWCSIWFLLVSNTPAEDKFIRRAEKIYLKETIIQKSDGRTSCPWKNIIGSKSVWVYFNDCLVQAWFFSFMVFCLPLYVKDVSQKSVEEVGFISGIPNLLSVLGLALASYLADNLRTKKIFSITNVHKIFIGLAHITNIIFFTAAAFWNNLEIAMICFTVTKFISCMSHPSTDVLPIDMALNYAGVLRGISAAFMSIALILNPLMIGFMIPNHSLMDWSRYFIFLSLFNLWGGTMFLIFGSAEPEPWAISKIDTKQQTTATKEEYSIISTQ